MRYYFLKEDFGKLNDQIFEINQRIKKIGQQMGAACQEGAETFHDNFAFEDGERQQSMWSQRLIELIEINTNAEIFEPSGPDDRVTIGCQVTVYDVAADDEKTIKIGSYMTFNGSETVSYAAPLAKLLLGAAVGEVKKGQIGGRTKEFEILDIK